MAADPYVDPALLPVVATVLALAGIRTGDAVVDVGCGPGLLTHPAAAAAGAYGRVVGLDPDPALVAYARHRRPSSTVWVAADPARLPVAGGVVTKVLCGAVHALAEPERALAEVRRVLAPGGRLVACAWAGGVDLPGLVAAAGLRVGRADTTEVSLPFPDRAAYLRWRATSPGAPGPADPGDGPLLVHGVVAYVVGTAP